MLEQIILFVLGAAWGAVMCYFLLPKDFNYFDLVKRYHGSRLIKLMPRDNNGFETPMRVWSCADCEAYTWVLVTDGVIRCAQCHAMATALTVSKADADMRPTGGVTYELRD